MAGEMMSALASLGTSYFASYDILTVTSVPAGLTDSTLPTGTPRIRTSEPSYRETVRGNDAVRYFLSWLGQATTTSATTMPITATIDSAFVIPPFGSETA